MHLFTSRSRNRFYAGAALCVLALCAFALARPALAQTLSATTQLAQVASESGIPTTSVAVIIARVIRVFIGTLGIVFTVIVLYSGFIYMTAQGDPDKVKKAVAMIKNGIIGLILCLSSYTIATYILNRILDAAGMSGGTSSITAKYSEPLSGSLGAGIIESHYPERLAIDIPRNTRIMVTFKEPINPASLISGYDANPASTYLNTENVSVYATASGASAKLEASDVSVTFNEAGTIFVFDPVELLGSSVEDTNYTVLLGKGIEKTNGSAAFTGVYSGGYEWTFEVSTEVDLTPPTVVSVLPSADAEEARNVTVSITFSEPMDPVAATGTYAASASSGNFRNIEIEHAAGSGSAENVDGTFVISNGYRTVEFTPTDACGQDPCGDIIYCLPGNETVSVTAHAATLGDDPPQAYSVGVTFDGLVDASVNSLDGDGDGTAQGSDADTVVGSDDYLLPSFTTTDEINDTVPTIVDMSAGIREGNVDQDADVDITFSIAMKPSTLNSSNISLWPDPWYEFWFSVGKTDVLDAVGSVDHTVASVSHGTMVSPDDLGWDYWPAVTRGVKSNWQICMYPAYGPSAYAEGDTSCRGDSAGNPGVSSSEPYCCDGQPSATACATSVSGISLPDTSKLDSSK